MITLMKTITKKHVSDTLDKTLPPAASCVSGETVIFETRDCYDDAVISEDRPLGEKTLPLENPATGPLYIEDARPGDILKIEILDIRLRDWGIMRSSPTAGVFHADFSERRAKIFQLAVPDKQPFGQFQGKVSFDESLTLNLCPMVGVIGTAPAGSGIPTDTPGSHGGNMDCRKIGKGSILYLPIYVEGALLFMGDLHALMGDGEVFICGLEIGGAVTVRVNVLKGMSLPTPFLFCHDHVMTIQSAATLDEAGSIAAKAMKDFVKSVMKKGDFEAGMLMSLVSHMVVCQVVDPLKTVRMEFPLSALEAYGYRLP